MPLWHLTKKKNKLHWSQEARSLCHWPTQGHFWLYSARTTCCSGCWWWWCWAWAVKKQKQHHQLSQRAMMLIKAVLNTSWMRSSGGPISLTLVNLPKKIGSCKALWEFSEKTIFGLILIIWIQIWLQFFQENSCSCVINLVCLLVHNCNWMMAE